MMRRFLCDQTGTTAIEYAVIGALIFLVIVSAIVPIGGQIAGVFNQAAAGFAG
jgi:Flp pilus assembly pilin Flp